MERIDQRDIDHGGRKLTVIIVRDDDVTPYDADCYSPEEIDGWRRDDWQYVGVLLMDGDAELDSLWGVEYGTFAEVSIDMDTLVTSHPVPDMLRGIGS